MNYLSVENISKAFGDKVLFSDVTFGIEKGDKTALIATNGSGKTTMLKILTGSESADTGTIAFCKDIKVAYLEQLPQFDESLTVEELIANMDHTDMLATIRRYETALKKHTDESNKVTKQELEHAIAEMDVRDAWSYDLRIKQMLSRFEIHNLSQKIGELSGGQVKRLALALVLLDNPEFLILDEPTNHLDVEMVEWLEKYLAQANITLLMVTHDRYFLDHVCNKIFELYQGTMYTHQGNFDYYVKKSREREEVKRATAEKAGQLLKHELEWIRSTPQARTGKSKSRIDAFYELKEKAKIQHDDNELQFGLNMQRLGGKILEMHNVNKSFGPVKVVQDFEYVFKRGDRIGIVGKNGVGKTSFLDIMTGNIIPDSGTVTTGETVVYGYYRQEGISFDENQTVLDAIKDIAEVIRFGKDKVLTAEQLLAHFMFPYKMHRQPIYLLSGGEKRRLYLLTVLVRNPNFLILDEPTNDLDLLTLQRLEDFLQSYKGCLIVVSHDRFFMDEVVDQLFVFQGDGKIKGFIGNYSQYRQYLQQKNKEEQKELSAQKKNSKEYSRPREKKKRSFKEQREYEQLQEEIAALENEKEKLNAELLQNTNYQEIEKISLRIKEVTETLDIKELRWLELDEIEQ